MSPNDFRRRPRPAVAVAGREDDVREERSRRRLSALSDFLAAPDPVDVENYLRNLDEGQGGHDVRPMIA